MSRPEAILLCGLTGSGKTTHAKQLVEKGYKKLSIDETMHSKYGQYGVDYSPRLYSKYESIVENELKHELASLLQSGASVVLDFGFWKRAKRDEYKQIIEENGGRWRLVYFKASPELLRKRLEERNKQDDAKTVSVTKNMLRDFIERFEEPSCEGEDIVSQ